LILRKFFKIFIFSILAFAGIFWFGGEVFAANCGDTDINGVTDTTCACGDTLIGAVDYTYQLPGNLSCAGDGLVVGANNITIDGDSHTLDGDDGTGDYGIDNSGGWDDISVENLNITDFNRGIYFLNSVGAEGQVIQNNNVSSCNTGIMLSSSSSSNTLTGNTANSNSTGIYLSSSSSNTLTSNTTNLCSSYGIYLYSSSSNTLTSNTTNLNTTGIRLSFSDSNTLTSNTINLNLIGIYLVSSDSNTLTSNTINSNTSNIKTEGTMSGIYLISSDSNTLNSNIVFNNIQDLYNTGTTNTYSSNQFSHNATSKMFTFVEPTRTYSVGNAISFDISMFNPDGTACSDCTYAITSSPSETITSSQNSNQITGSFTATKSGTYSLLFAITDSSSNITKRNLRFFVGAAQTKTTKYYLRRGLPTHGQPAGNGNDSQSLYLTAPTSTEEWWCGSWVQNSPDELPNYPLSNLTDIYIYSWYKQDMADGAYIGVQRYLDFDLNVDYSSSVSAVAEYTENTKSFDLSALGGDWAMDYAWNWYWLSLKLGGTDIYASYANPYWTTFPSGHTVDEASYANFTYSYTITPAVKSVSNDDVNVLSATAPTTDTDDATMVLDYPVSGTASANIVLGDPDNSHAFRRPFESYTTTINSDGTATLQATGITSDTLTITSVPMDITPNAGTIDVNITTWNTSGTYSKEWTETGTGATSAAHTIGDLAASEHYTITVDGSSTGITGDDCEANVCLSNASGQIVFTYSGGYSSHTFTVSQSNIAPTPTNFTATASGLTSASLSVDTFADDTLGSAGYYFYLAGDEANHNSGWIQTNAWQDTNADAHFFCAAHPYYVKYRNRDAIETASVSATASFNCGGGPLLVSFSGVLPDSDNNIDNEQKTKEQQSTNIQDPTQEQREAEIEKIKQLLIKLLIQVIQLLTEKIARMSG